MIFWNDHLLLSSAEKNKSKGGRGSKKQVFECYMTLEEVSHGLKRGELIQVLLHVKHFLTSDPNVIDPKVTVARPTLRPGFK